MASYEDRLKKLFQSMGGKGEQPLAPGDPAYVEILERSPETDPILALHKALEWSESESVHLLTGFRGNGKSTQLRRLKHLLERTGATVYLVDMTSHMLMTKPVEISDFILSLMVGLSKVVEQEDGTKPLTRRYWQRLVALLKTEVTFKEIELGAEFDSVSATVGQIGRAHV